MKIPIIRIGLHAGLLCWLLVFACTAKNATIYDGKLVDISLDGKLGIGMRVDERSEAPIILEAVNLLSWRDHICTVIDTIPSWSWSAFFSSDGFIVYDDTIAGIVRLDVGTLTSETVLCRDHIPCLSFDKLAMQDEHNLLVLGCVEGLVFVEIAASGPVLRQCPFDESIRDVYGWTADGRGLIASTYDLIPDDSSFTAEVSVFDVGGDSTVNYGTLSLGGDMPYRLQATGVGSPIYVLVWDFGLESYNIWKYQIGETNGERVTQFEPPLSVGNFWIRGDSLIYEVWRKEARESRVESYEVMLLPAPQ